ncbi:lysoplasmalogenase family protein [Dactylosporangium sp. CA-139066]|uniref:lysoplasmalogenase family protein n=1 Tax=Dactylosporangium sp. CA-139066 TaxID=3239930 RepID=UPI003D8BF480
MRRAALALFGVAAVAELAAVAAGVTPLQWAAKPLLAPLLIWYLAGRRDLVTAGLVFATAGDVVLLIPGRLPFLAGMACFLGTQVCLLIAFVRAGRPRVAAVAGYAVLWAGLNALLWGHLGALRGPILGYSMALAAMACAATGVSARVGLGGALFLGSDLLIGAGAAGMDFPGRDVVVMATYAAALALIATGWAAVRPPAPAAVAVRPAGPGASGGPAA